MSLPYHKIYSDYKFSEKDKPLLTRAHLCSSRLSDNYFVKLFAMDGTLLLSVAKIKPL